MKKLLVLLSISITLFSCNQNASESKLAETDSLGGMTIGEMRAKLKDSLDKDMVNSIYFKDTVGEATAPVKVIKARPITKDYSTYKDISVTYKNVSDKSISAIRFMWHGINAFGESADMGLIGDGFGTGFADEVLRPGKSVTHEWSILSRDLKKVTKAWAYEVVFEDGTKWKLSK